MIDSEMKYVAAGLAAAVAFLVSYCLLAFLEGPILDLLGWKALDLPWSPKWWRTGLGLTLAVCAFRLVVEWRNNAALKWRKALAARARA